MARTIEEIQEQIITNIQEQTELSGLSSTSRTAIWRLITYVIASAIHFHEMIYDTFKAEVNELVERTPAGTPGWYVFQLFEFQKGDVLELVDDIIQYENDDPSKKIITRAAYEDRPDLLILKAAKDGDQGAPIPLTSDEVTQVTAYLNRKKFAGTKIEFRSTDPDTLRIAGTLYINPEITTGNYYDKIKEAVDEYLSGISFGGIFYIQKLTDALQGIEGVDDVQLTAVEIVNALGDIVSVYRRHQLYSGYAVLEDSADYQLQNHFTILYDNV